MVVSLFGDWLMAYIGHNFENCTTLGKVCDFRPFSHEVLLVGYHEVMTVQNHLLTIFAAFATAK